MSSVFFYKPFYNFDHFFDNIFIPCQAIRDSNQVTQWSVDGAMRSLKPRNINIDIHNNCLIVSAETKQVTKHEENGYAVRECHFGKFSCTLQLPQGVKVQEIKASMENRVL